MATYASYGYEPLDWLSDAQAIGYGGTAADSSEMAYVDYSTNGKLEILVFAHTAISIASGEYFNIEIETYSTDTSSSAIAPFSTGNEAGHVVPAGGTAETNAHYYGLHKTSGDEQLDFVAGDLITQIGVPDLMMQALGHKYIQIKTVTDKTDPGTDETIDAFIVARI